MSRELELTLTGRDCGLSERAPMCGVPYHAADTYIARLISKGYKVAICEQMTDPADSKGLVKREVTRVVTPGTVIESSMLDERSASFILAVTVRRDRAGLAFLRPVHRRIPTPTAARRRAESGGRIVPARSPGDS